MSTYPRVVLGTTKSGSGELWTEHPTVAVDLGNGLAGCITLDKGWTYSRNWSEVTVEKDYVVYSPEFPQEQKGWQALLRQIAEAKSAAAAWEDQALDYKAHLELAEQRIRELEENPPYNPSVLVLEDKDIEAVEVKSIDDGRWWLADDALVNTPEYPDEKEAREAVEEHLAQAAGAEAVARAIEKKREDHMRKVRIKNNQKDDDA